MKKIFTFVLFIFLLLGCSSKEYKTIDAKQAKEMMKQDHVVIIDVREEHEYQQGHIPNALLIPLGTINKDNENLPDQSQTLLIYCRSGNRSRSAAQEFVNLGYENVYNFGGIIDWPYEVIQ